MVGERSIPARLWPLINDLVLAIEEAVNLAELRRVLMAEIRSLIEYDRGVFDLAKSEDGRIFFHDPYSVEIAPDFLRRYYDYFQYIDTMNFFFSQHKRDIYRTSDYISQKMRVASEYYQEWYRPQNLFYSMGSRVADGADCIASVNFWRKKKAGDYTLIDMRVLGIVNEHLSKRVAEFLRAEEAERLQSGGIKNFFAERGLTEREQEIAFLIYDGHHIHEIAQSLFITEDTVKKHSNHIYRKLGVDGRMNLAAKLRKITGGSRGELSSPADCQKPL